MINFTIYGEAHGKGRPRFRKMGNFVKTYTDKDTINYETLVKLSYVDQTGQHPNYFNNEALSMDITIYQAIPASTSKKKQQQMLDGEIHPTKKPDVDNVIKSILDGLNGVAFGDDKQIIEISAIKKYAREPRVEVRIKEFREGFGF